MTWDCEATPYPYPNASVSRLISFYCIIQGFMSGECSKTNKVLIRVSGVWDSLSPFNKYKPQGKPFFTPH